MSKAYAVRVKVLGRLIREKRRSDGLTLAQVATVTNISPATLSRLERQYAKDEASFTPTANTVAALSRWLRVPLETILDAGVQNDEDSQDVENHLRAVETHLRARRNIDAKSMKILVSILSLAYQQATGTEPMDEGEIPDS